MQHNVSSTNGSTMLVTATSVSHRSPSVMGIFAADRGFLGEIGGLDGGMTVYGGENVELGIRVSSCKC